MINYQSTGRLAAPTGSTEPWNFASVMMPHPVNFGWYTHVGEDGAVGDFDCFLNSQLAGADHQAKMQSFIANVERFRLAYMGVSVHFDGPALANQGTVVCSQTACAPLTLSLSGPSMTGYQAFSKVCAPDSADPAVFGSDFPDFDKSVSMPNSYTGEVKDGLYIPLKLTKTCQQWRSRSDLVGWLPPTLGEDGFRALPTAVATLSYPHPGIASPYYATGRLNPGTATSPFLNDVVAHVCGRNISPQSALIFTFRVGIEAQVEPGTLLSPYQRVSPVYDSQALKAYFTVARELKDAYPVEYNDFGKLWNVISSAVKTAAPLLDVAMPGAGRLATLGAGFGDQVAEHFAKKARKAPPKQTAGARSLERAPAATQQRVREANRRALSQPPRTVTLSLKDLARLRKK